MKLIIEVTKFPSRDIVSDAEEMERLRQAVIRQLEADGYPFGSGYGVWAFHDD